MEKTLLPRDAPAALTGSANFGGASLGGSGAHAFFTYVVFLKDDFFFFSVESILKRYLQVVAEASSL
jgi:hypothetical protein